MIKNLGNPCFDFRTVPQHWIKHDLYITHMFNTPSLMLPLVEGFVNFSAQHTLPHITDFKLYDSCKKFIEEERSHAKQHIEYNRALLNYAYHASQEITQLKSQLQKIKKSWSPLSLLALAVGCECFAAIISHVTLSTNVLDDAHPTMKSFWNWHMGEELQHRSVLMDVYKHLGGGYWRRIGLLTVVLLVYCKYSTKIYFKLLKKDSASKIKGLKTVLNRQSFFRKSLIATLQCYRFKYHPSQIATENFTH